MASRIEYTSLDDLVYAKVKEMILDKQLKPGERILQEQLAKKLGISRSPVRKVLSQLAKEHLVTIVPRGGAYVKEFSIEEMLAIFAIREVFEGLACREAVSVVSKDELNFFKNLFKKAVKSAGHGDWRAYLKADEEFHSFLIQRTRTDLLREMITSFNILSNSYVRGLIRPPEETFPEHMAIIDALMRHNSDLAENLMREHHKKCAALLKQSGSKNSTIRP